MSETASLRTSEDYMTNAKQKAREQIILRIEESMELTMLRIIGARTREERVRRETQLAQLVLWASEIIAQQATN